ncbi:hypothetical protein BG011_005463 [Mortierella polycephala]|uniref:rRNA methyltransferase 1, mitochondrial n=1 Tax=Mortierella polycephala TaxID=41804 RepID=A0A9P6U0W5_9FUNG|nr:hypothetical protein BG011_005463 [Mortierella polycephala]
MQSDRDYLYSPNVVLPALKNGLRTPYTLKKEDLVANCIAAANSAGVKVVKTDKHQLNAMAGQRPHQGVVLEASRLEQRMVTTLGGVSVDNQYNISGRTTETWFKTKENEPPVWLALDEVVDPQNLGAILRTAMFMGVNGVVVCHKNSSPLSAVVAKASTGALEARPTYGVSSLMRFIQMSKENGWHVVGAHVTYGSKRTRPLHTWPETGVDQPTLLIMGNEGNGLRKQIMNQCDSFIQVPCLSLIPSNVDSLNVSVATGIILSKLMGGRFLNLPENLKKYPWRNKDATDNIGTVVKKAGGEQETDDDDNDDDDDVDDNDVDDNEGEDGEEENNNEINTKSPSAPEKPMPW